MSATLSLSPSVCDGGLTSFYKVLMDERAWWWTGLSISPTGAGPLQRGERGVATMGVAGIADGSCHNSDRSGVIGDVAIAVFLTPMATIYMHPLVTS